MKFKINNKQWEIIELEREYFYETRKSLAEEDRNVFQEHGTIFGTTDLAYHKIYLNKGQTQDELKSTLIHELTHTWLWSNGASYTSYEEEALCDTVSASYDTIHKIVEDYFKGAK